MLLEFVCLFLLEFLCLVFFVTSTVSVRCYGQYKFYPDQHETTNFLFFALSLHIQLVLWPREVLIVLVLIEIWINLFKFQLESDSIVGNSISITNEQVIRSCGHQALAFAMEDGSPYDQCAAALQCLILT